MTLLDDHLDLARTSEDVLPARSRRRGTTLLAGGAAVLLLGLAGASGAWAAATEEVTVSADGRTTSVSTLDGTVQDVLADAGVTLSPQDAVTPALGASVPDGAAVVVERATLLRVDVDGDQRVQWVTGATVDEALRAADVPTAADGAVVSVPGDAPLAELPTVGPREEVQLSVRTPREVVVQVDGTTTPLLSTAASTGDLLAEAGVTVDGDDRVLPPLDVRPDEGATVAVVRVAVTDETHVLPAPAGTQRVETDELLRGQTRTDREAVDGQREETVRVTREDGETVAAELVGERVLREPVTGRVLVGTRAPAPPPPAPRASAPSAPAASSSPSSSSPTSRSGRPAPAAAQQAPAPAAQQAPAPSGSGRAQSLNWAALARCESGGDPGAVSSTGKYRGLYQFSRATWASVGGSGDPAAASPGEQTARAQRLYDAAGAGQWPECGPRLFS